MVRGVALGIIGFAAGWINLVKSHCPQSVKPLLLLFWGRSIGYAQPLWGDTGLAGLSFIVFSWSCC